MNGSASLKFGDLSNEGSTDPTRAFRPQGIASDLPARDAPTALSGALVVYAEMLFVE